MSLPTTTLRRGRRVAAASLVAAAALSLTACQSGDGKASGAPSASSGQEAPGGAAARAMSGGSTAGGQAGGDSPTGTGRSAPGGAPADLSGVSGSWVGRLKWLTEDKLSVAPDYGPEQAFHIAGSTRALGAAALCEAPDGRVHTDGPGYGTTVCTLDDLRKAARMGTVDVRVTVQGGVAAKIAERYHP
ncbi:hypothetical protein [Streptomyces angustmyceticus]|uniref:hypothetical protein n=1 Tax=Streptomyces angustmyceticus TaxID=285578 RepID=UPI0021B05BC4|nr:hypothetical protein [Streptomyces angustmyceticus]